MDWESTPTDTIEQMAVAAERAIARIRAHQLACLAELDARQVPGGDGSRSLGEWTAGRLDVSPESARTLAQTAVRLRTEPALAEALESGAISFDRTAELAKAGDIEPDDIEASLHIDIAGLRRRTAMRRRMSRRDEAEVFGERFLHMQPTLDLSAYRLWGELPGYAGRVVEKALDERADAMPAPPGGPEALGRRRVDALVSIAEDSFGDAGAAAHGGGGGPLVSIFVDAGVAGTTGLEAGVAVDTGVRVGPETMERLLCEGRVEVNIEGGTPLGVGRSSRVIPPRLRRAVLRRDGGCVVDGCASRYRLQPHHVVPWSQGGRTDPGNLATVCWFHHHVVIHGQGLRLDPESPPLRRRFIREVCRPPDS